MIQLKVGNNSGDQRVIVFKATVMQNLDKEAKATLDLI